MAGQVLLARRTQLQFRLSEQRFPLNKLSFLEVFQAHSLLISSFFGLFGLFFGSFFAVVVDRIPLSQSIFKGRSYCDSCKKHISWYDLIPVVSFFLLRRRCRHCKAVIAYFYPIIEVATGVLFFAVTYLSRAQSFLDFLFLLFVTSILIIIFFTDLKYGVIPFAIILPSLVFICLWHLTHHSIYISEFLLSGVSASAFFLFLFIVTRGRGMGFGDVIFALFMGVLLGFPDIVVALYIAFLTGAFVSIILILLRKKHFQGGTVPFGPFMAVGTLLALLYGQSIWKYILILMNLYGRMV